MKVVIKGELIDTESIISISEICGGHSTSGYLYATYFNITLIGKITIAICAAWGGPDMTYFADDPKHIEMKKRDDERLLACRNRLLELWSPEQCKHEILL